MANRNGAVWLLHIPGWSLLAYLTYAQAIPAFDYELGVRMGTQESAAQITDVGVAFFFGFALGDLLVYIPLLAIGLIGLLKKRPWARVITGAALGITVYWPIVSLAAVTRAREATGWNLGDETAYWVVLPLVAAWAIWGLWWIARSATVRAPMTPRS